MAVNTSLIVIFIQVLSNNVGKALRTMKRAEYKETVEFFLMMDKLFDCLNASNLWLPRNAFKAPYHSAEDFRIKVR